MINSLGLHCSRFSGVHVRRWGCALYRTGLFYLGEVLAVLASALLLNHQVRGLSLSLSFSYLVVTGSHYRAQVHGDSCFRQRWDYRHVPSHLDSGQLSPPWRQGWCSMWCLRSNCSPHTCLSRSFNLLSRLPRPLSFCLIFVPVKIRPACCPFWCLQSIPSASSSMGVVVEHLSWAYGLDSFWAGHGTVGVVTRLPGELRCQTGPKLCCLLCRRPSL